jgi:hypothetical protein
MSMVYEILTRDLFTKAIDKLIYPVVVLIVLFVFDRLDSAYLRAFLTPFQINLHNEMTCS